MHKTNLHTKNRISQEQQRKCLDDCERSTSEKLVFKKIMSTESLRLLCRDDKRLVFTSEGRESQSNGTIYIFKIVKNSSDMAEIYMVSVFFTSFSENCVRRGWIIRLFIEFLSDVTLYKRNTFTFYCFTQFFRYAFCSL